MSDAVRQAASVIAVRDTDAGAEVLVIERSRSSRFLPGYVAFPGGAVDEPDVALARRWFGSASEAARACAVRELVEEVGLALTSAGLGPCGSGAFDAIESLPPRSDQLAAICRWIAPPDVPVRFDAEYFAVAAPPGLVPVADGAEAGDAWWVSPERLLAEWGEGDRRLYWPTYFTVRTLARCSTVDDLLGLRFATREPDEEELGRLPRSVFWQEEP